MRRRKVLISTDSRETALQQAAVELGTTVDNIELTTVGDGRYSADVRDADAEIDFEVSEDRMQVTIASFAPPKGKGSLPSLESVKGQFAQAGITAEPDPDAVAYVSERLGDGLSVRGVCLASGTPPKGGADGRFDLAVEVEPSVGSVQEDGSVDFYERGLVCSVTKGAVLGRVVPHEKGTPGRDVYGRPHRARDGQPCRIYASRNVKFFEDGLEFRAQVDGMVVFARNALSVVEKIEVRGDVDFSSGNIHMLTGSVSVRGAIRSGFTVISGGSLTVGEAIENATVEAAGDVRVRRGIIMQEEGRLKAGGTIVAHFAQNARIEAGGDLIIDNDITNCDITVDGKVVTSRGRGRIQGGTVRCAGGVEANEISSALNVPTALVVCCEPFIHRDLLAERRALREQARRTATTLNMEDTEGALLKAALDAEATQIIEGRSRNVKRLREVEEALQQHLEHARKSTVGGVRVRGTAHPGTVITIAGCTLEVKEPISASRIFYDPEIDGLRIAPL